MAEHPSEDEPGVRLSEAHLHYCHPDILKKFNDAGARAGWKTRRVVTRSGGLPPREILRSDAVAEYRAAQKAAAADLVSKLHDGRLSAAGFVVGRLGGRDPDAPRRTIPKDVWASRTLRPGWRTDTVDGNGLKFTGVRVYSRYETPESASALIGHSLAECYQMVVVDDWVRQEMEELAFARFPSWKIRPSSYGFYQAYIWPVCFEKWSKPSSSVTMLKFPVVSTNSHVPEPPEEIVAVRARIERQVRHLLGLLRDETLVADGVVEPKEHDLRRKVIAADWWRQPDVEFDHSESCLFKVVQYKRVCMFSEIRICDPARPIQKIDDRAQPKEAARSKGKPGRKPSWDWPAATKELISLANTPDGLPYPQAELERHFADWFVEACGDSPSESAIRDFIVKLLPDDYHKAN